jgi:hypothetical protein
MAAAAAAATGLATVLLVRARDTRPVAADPARPALAVLE